MAQSTFLWIALAFSKNSRTFAPQMRKLAALAENKASFIHSLA